MSEIWKNIPKYDDYQVSNLGNVKSLKGLTERILKASLSNDYPAVKLCLDNKWKAFKVHKLMQIAFGLGEGVSDHINGCKTDNRLENLRVVTIRENNHNKECHRNGKSVGATCEKARAHLARPWRAQIRVNSKQKHLGYFKTEFEAHQAYKKEFNKLVRK